MRPAGSGAQEKAESVSLTKTRARPDRGARHPLDAVVLRYLMAHALGHASNMPDAIGAGHAFLKASRRQGGRRESHQMFSHITVGTRDLERAGRFYGAVLLPLGLKRRAVTPDGGPAALCWVTEHALLPRFYVYMPYDGEPASAGNGSMVAFLAPTQEAVSAAHAGGLAQGGTDEGAPGMRPHYGDGYFGAYLRDPDGNKVHIVHRGDLPL